MNKQQRKSKCHYQLLQLDCCIFGKRLTCLLKEQLNLFWLCANRWFPSINFDAVCRFSMKATTNNVQCNKLNRVEIEIEYTRNTILACARWLKRKFSLFLAAEIAQSSSSFVRSRCITYYYTTYRIDHRLFQNKCHCAEQAYIYWDNCKEKVQL